MICVGCDFTGTEFKSYSKVSNPPFVLDFISQTAPLKLSDYSCHFGIKIQWFFTKYYRSKKGEDYI